MKNKIVEIVGLAGVGKSSLASVLLALDPSMVEGRRISVKEIVQSPFLLNRVLKTIPQLSWQMRCGDRPTVQVTKDFVYANTWDHVLREQASASKSCVLVDQGPIFKLATLHGFGPEILRKEHSRWWWDRTFDRWTDSLSTIVHVVAPEDILGNRVRRRSKFHVLKQMDAKQQSEFFLIYRNSFEFVINEFRERKKVSVINIDSSFNTVDETAMNLLNEINQR